MENIWHTKSAAEVMNLLRTDENGLDGEEIGRRRQKYGANELAESKADNLAAVFLRQFQSPLIYILAAAGSAMFVMGETADGLIILAVLVFNAVIGAVQEGKAQNTLLALKQFVETKATVSRQGREAIISDSEVVPGDIIILQEGEKAPADARLILSRNLKIDEAMLTGESGPVHKIIEAQPGANLPIAEQRNMIFKGSYILSGYGKAVAVATGQKTVIGQIAEEIEKIDAEMPFKANVRYLSRLIIAAVSGISIFLFLFGVISGKSIVSMFATVVALAVSVIPEGLPIVMTLVLANGVRRLSRQNILVKKLQAVEALGQAQVIAVDKTGTITENEMVAQRVYAADNFFQIKGDGYEPEGEIQLNGRVINPADYPELALVGRSAAFAANARVMFSQAGQQWQVAGDPTEAAMQVLAQKLGFNKDELEPLFPLVVDRPFDYQLKYHASIHQAGGQALLTAAGAPEVILKLCRTVWRGGNSQEITAQDRDKLAEVFHKMSLNGLRVVALAEKRQSQNIPRLRAIGNLTFIGFLGIKDALRPAALKAVQNIKAAGIKVVMITGDHRNTAQAVAREAGIYRPGDTIITGEEIDNLTAEALAEKLSQTSVFARVAPEHKLRIIQAYKARGQVIAMTGDGVNDAPSLSAADLGIAMGKIGTEVAKEASDIVFLDDNLGNLIPAVEEGRNIYKTIKKVILYLFSTSAGETLAIAGALAAGWPLPILPAQIIWLNFVTDGFLDVALAMEPKEKGLLGGNFKKPNKFVVDKLMAQRIFLMSLPMAAGSLWLFSRYWQTDISKALTMSLTVLAVFQWFNAWNCRSEEKSIFTANPLANKFLIGATLIVASLQLLAVYHPWPQKFLHTVPLSLSDWLIILPVAAAIIAVEEVRKFFYRRKINY